MSINPFPSELTGDQDWQQYPPGTADESPPRYRLLTADQLKDLPKQEWAAKHLLPSEGLAAIFGASGSGKSFLALDLVAKLAEAGSFFGHGVPKVHRVVVLELEGQSGVPRRVQAWEVANGRPFPKNVQFVFDGFNLLEGADLAALAEAIQSSGGCHILAIDTLNRAAPGADENSSRDASLILESAKWLQAALGGLVLLIHHTGKDSTKGMRGHSSLFAAMDAVIEVNRTAGRREWTLIKSKDDSEGQSFGFMLEAVNLGADASGEAVTSCVIRTDDAPPDNRPTPPKGGNQRIVYDALAPLFRESTKFGKEDAPATRPCVELEDAIERVKDRLAVEPKRRRERVQQAITGMVASGVLGCSRGWLWLI